MLTREVCAHHKKLNCITAKLLAKRWFVISAVAVLATVTVMGLAACLRTEEPNVSLAPPPERVEPNAPNTSPAHLESIEQELARINTTITSMSGAVGGVNEQLGHLKAQLDARMAQIKLAEPILAEIVTTRYAPDDDNCYAVCRVFNRSSRGELVYVVKLDGDQADAFESTLKEVVGKADPGSQSFAQMNELISKTGIGPLAPPFIWSECSFILTDPPRDFEQSLTRALGAAPVRRQYALSSRGKATKWKDLVRRITSSPGTYQQALHMPVALKDEAGT